MKRLFNTLLIVGIALLAILFATLNTAQSALDLFFWQTEEHSLAVWLIISFVLGLVLGGLLVYLNMWFNLRRQVRLHRQQQNTQEESRPAPSEAKPGMESPAAIAHD